MGEFLRILLVSGIYFPDVGGPATFVPKLARHLLKNGHSVRVISLQNFKAVRPYEPWKRTFINRKLPRIIRFPLVICVIMFYGFNSNIIFANGLHEESVLAGKIIRKRVILKIVGDPIWERAKNRNLTNLDIREFNDIKVPKKLRLEKKLFSWILARAYKVISPSDELLFLMKKISPKCKTFFIPNGIKIKTIKNVERKFDVIYVGRLTKWKEVDTLITAVAKINKSLLIVGDGPEMQELKKLASIVGCKATFVGEKSSKELTNYYLSARVFCLPSSYEGMSHSLLEAMAHETPVVVSNIPANLALIQHGVNGLTFELRNYLDLSSQLLKLLNSETRSKELAIQAKKDIISKYDENLILNEYLELMESN